MCAGESEQQILSQSRKKTQRISIMEIFNFAKIWGKKQHSERMFLWKIDQSYAVIMRKHIEYVWVTPLPSCFVCTGMRLGNNNLYIRTNVQQ